MKEVTGAQRRGCSSSLFPKPKRIPIHISSRIPTPNFLLLPFRVTYSSISRSLLPARPI